MFLNFGQRDVADHPISDVDEVRFEIKDTDVAGVAQELLGQGLFLKQGCPALNPGEQLHDVTMWGKFVLTKELDTMFPGGVPGFPGAFQLQGDLEGFTILLSELCPGAKVNDARGTTHKNNVKCAQSEKPLQLQQRSMLHRLLTLEVTARIEPGEQLFLDYGSLFWKTDPESQAAACLMSMQTDKVPAQEDEEEDDEPLQLTCTVPEGSVTASGTNAIPEREEKEVASASSGTPGGEDAGEDRVTGPSAPAADTQIAAADSQIKQVAYAQLADFQASSAKETATQDLVRPSKNSTTKVARSSLPAATLTYEETTDEDAPLVEVQKRNRIVYTDEEQGDTRVVSNKPTM